jgi:dTDP-4-amino-4,6-dideoxygalactose transaminase
VSNRIPIAHPIIGKEEREAVRRVLDSGHLVQGERVAEFEDLFAEYIGTNYAVATSSGTAAIHAALKALEIGPGDEVILPAITFFSCAAMVAACGATPVAVDVSADTYTLDPERVTDALTAETRALMPVHLFGQSADLGPLSDLAEDHDLAVIEDACQSHGATYRDRRIGSFGRAGTFSFYPSKLITTGEGGMVVTDVEAIAEYVGRFRSHGEARKYEHEMIGFNYRMTDLEAAMGIEQMKRIEGFIEARSRNAAYLTDGLEGVEGLETPKVAEDRTHVFYQYILRVEDAFPHSRDELIAALRARGIESRPSYPRPIHEQAAFRGRGRAADCPVAERVLPRMLEIPVHPSLTQADLEAIMVAFDSLT